MAVHNNADTHFCPLAKGWTTLPPTGPRDTLIDHIAERVNQVRVFAKVVATGGRHIETFSDNKLARI